MGTESFRITMPILIVNKGLSNKTKENLILKQLDTEGVKYFEQFHTPNIKTSDEDYCIVE